MNALADLTNPAQISANALAAFDAGQKRAQEERQRIALERYAADPSVANANALMPYAPELSLKLQSNERDRQFSEAAARYYGGNNKLAAPPIPASNAPGAAGGVAQGGVSGPQTPTQGPQQPSAAADLSVLGAPQSEADVAFLQMLKADPKRAFQIQSDMRDRARERLKLQNEAYGFAAQRLGGVVDEASYQMALGDIQQQLTPLGVNVTDHLPPHFPGADGLRSLRLNALTAKDQLSYFLNEGNVNADNARADRNTDNLVATRNARVAEDRRYHDMTDGTRRRGQDINASTSRRGQDLRGSGRGGRASMPTVSSPEEAAKLAPGTKFRTPDGTVRVRP